MKKDLKVLKFPSSISTLERKVEAVLFAAEEPLDEETIRFPNKNDYDKFKMKHNL